MKQLQPASQPASPEPSAAGPPATVALQAQALSQRLLKHTLTQRKLEAKQREMAEAQCLLRVQKHVEIPLDVPV